MTRGMAVPLTVLAGVALAASLAGCGPTRARDAVGPSGVGSSGVGSSGVDSSGVGSPDVGSSDVDVVEGALARADQALKGVAEQIDQDR